MDFLTLQEDSEVVKRKISEYVHRAEELKSLMKPISDWVSWTETLASPSPQLSSHIADLPNVEWDLPNVDMDADVIGLSDVKKTLKSFIIDPLKVTDRPSYKSVLLYGPPGCGKTYISRSIIGQCKRTVQWFSVSCYMLPPNAEAFTTLFSLAKRHAPCVFLLDDFECLEEPQNMALKESTLRLLKRFKQESMLPGANESGVVLLVSTHSLSQCRSEVWDCFHKTVYVGLLEEENERTMLLKHLMDSSNTDIAGDVRYEVIAQRTSGYTTSDLICLTRDAQLEPARRVIQSKFFKKTYLTSDNYDFKWEACDGSAPEAVQFERDDIPFECLLMPPVTMDDMLKALKQSRPSISEDEIHSWIAFQSTN